MGASPAPRASSPAPQTSNPAPAQQTPQFRGGTDIVAIDFLAFDADGRPVQDLKPNEITLKVSGRVRDIKSVQFVRLSATGAPAARPASAPALPLPFGTNEAGTVGRVVMIVIDHEQIRQGEGKGAIDAASRFLDRLAPTDRVGLVTMPNGRLEVDLTTTHDRVRKALSLIVGRAPRRGGISNISLDEALTVLKERIDPDKKFTNELIDRECKFAPEDSFCRTNVVQEALLLARDAELQTRASLTALAGLLKGLAPMEGPKSILFLSGSLVQFDETHLDLQEVARAAAAARAQMFVIQPHEAMLDATRRDQPPTMSIDDNRRLAGLQDLAGATGGELFRLSGPGDAVYARIADQISAYYLLGFEPRASEQNGKPHEIEISTTRPRVTIRARPMFVIDDPSRTPPPPLQPETLVRDPGSHHDLPLRAVAYTFRDIDPKHVKVVVAVEPVESAATLTSAAFALVDISGERAAQWSEDGANVVRRPLLTGAAVPPGDYRLRVAAVDTTGRRGVVDYEFTAALTEAAPLSLGTLMLGWSDNGTFRPRLLLEPGATSVTGYVELYGVMPPGSSIGVSFEIAAGPDGVPLASAPGRLLASADRDRLVATGEIPLDGRAPGDYAVRVTVSVNGKVAGTAWRTLRVPPR